MGLMVSSFILVLAAATASAIMTLVFLVLFFVQLPSFFVPAISRTQKAHDALLLATYALFPVQLLTGLMASGGTLGDGATSMFRFVTPFTLVAVPCIQLAAFAAWIYARLALFEAEPKKSDIVAVFPAIVPVGNIILWFGCCL
jgi:hypothetical protein